MVGFSQSCISTAVSASSSEDDYWADDVDSDVQPPDIRFVCDTQEGLEQALTKVVDIMQIVNRDIRQTLPKRERRKLGCEWLDVPRESPFLFTGFLETDEGFIFPMFTYTDGFYYKARNPAHAVALVFESKNWKISTIREFQTGELRKVLTPKSCEALHRQYPSSVERGVAQAPHYVFIPAKCRIYRN
jgi:hypothetical protein